MTEQEIIRRLRIIQLMPTMSDVAQLARVNRRNLYNQLTRGRFTEHSRQALGHALRQLECFTEDQNRGSQRSMGLPAPAQPGPDQAPKSLKSAGVQYRIGTQSSNIKGLVKVQRS